jgi:phosphonatase-like hydrolase
MRVRLFVFDIAGTTVRDDNIVHRAFMMTASGADLRADDDWIKARMGWNKVQVFRELLTLNGRPTGDATLLAERFTRAIMDEMDTRPPVPLAGAQESLHAFRENGVKVAFNTGYSAALAHEIISRVGWAPDAIIGSDKVERGRPAPDMIRLAMTRTGVADPSHVGVAGDTPSDLRAGDAAGCRFVVGVGHGTHTLDELRPHPHSHLLPDLTTLPEVLRG